MQERSDCILLTQTQCTKMGKLVQYANAQKLKQPFFEIFLEQISPERACTVQNFQKGITITSSLSMHSQRLVTYFGQISPDFTFLVIRGCEPEGLV